MLRCNKNGVIRQRYKSVIVDKHNFVNSNDVLNWLETGNHVGLNLKSFGLVCLNIKNKKLFFRILKICKNYNCIATTTPEGGQIFFCCNEKMNKNRGDVLLALGFIAEIKMSNAILLGKNYKIIFPGSFDDFPYGTSEKKKTKLIY